MEPADGQNGRDERPGSNGPGLLAPNREKAAPRSAAALTALIGRYLHRPSPAALKPPLGHIRPITKNDLGALRRIITLIPSGMVLMESCLASVI
jgi:hypothetical protein